MVKVVATVGDIRILVIYGGLQVLDFYVVLNVGFSETHAQFSLEIWRYH